MLVGLLFYILDGNPWKDQTGSALNNQSCDERRKTKDGELCDIHSVI